MAKRPHDDFSEDFDDDFNMDWSDDQEKSRDDDEDPQIDWGDAHNGKGASKNSGRDADDVVGDFKDELVELVQGGKRKAAVNLAKAQSPKACEQALHELAEEGEINGIRAILETEQNINCRGEDGESLLMVAAFHRHRPVVKMLISRGCDPTLADNDGTTALTYAAAGGDLTIVKLIFDENRKVSEEDLLTALEEAADNGHREVFEFLAPNVEQNLVAPLVKDLVQGETRREQQNEPADHPDTQKFLKASIVGDLSGIERGIASGVDLDAVDESGNSALFNAMMHVDQPEIVQILVDAGAKVNFQDWDNMTPLMFGVCANNPEGVRILLAAGADKKLRNDEGETALDLAKERNFDELIAILTGGVVADDVLPDPGPSPRRDSSSETDLFLDSDSDVHPAVDDEILSIDDDATEDDEELTLEENDDVLTLDDDEELTLDDEDEPLSRDDDGELAFGSDEDLSDGFGLEETDEFSDGFGIEEPDETGADYDAPPASRHVEGFAVDDRPDDENDAGMATLDSGGSSDDPLMNMGAELGDLDAAFAGFVDLDSNSGMGGSFDQLHLESHESIDWEDPGAAEQAKAVLENNGFVLISSYQLIELPDLSLQAYVNSNDQLYGVIFESFGSGVWVDFTTLYKNKSSVSYTNAVNESKPLETASRKRIPLPLLSVQELLERCLAERPAQEIDRLNAKYFVTDFQKYFREELEARGSGE